MQKVVTRIDNNRRRNHKKISYRLQVIDSARFMASSLSNCVNNLAEGNLKIKCKYKHADKKYEKSGIKYKHCDRFIGHANFKDDLIKYTCLSCNNNY